MNSSSGIKRQGQYISIEISQLTTWLHATVASHRYLRQQ